MFFTFVETSSCGEMTSLNCGEEISGEFQHFLLDVSVLQLLIYCYFVWVHYTVLQAFTKPEHVPVTSSRTSLSVVFLRRRSRAGTPPQFLSATLLLSVALPYTRFLRAPQALFCTSATLWSSRSTRCWIPPRWHTCRAEQQPITEAGELKRNWSWTQLCPYNNCSF